VIYLDLDELLHIAGRVLPSVDIRDVGLLEVAATRPRATAFGEDAYATICEKAAALLHSVARNRALIDGNKRLALTAVIAFFGVNGWRLSLSNDAAYALVHAVAAGELTDIAGIAAQLAKGSRRR
jgi:death-on-curing protein